ncbi:hypothetical protein [Dongia sp.]|uniref:hypothetical protein n=1 Tax=Dongia sp. TaxID=1977262 RepID=UPI0035B36B8E
MDGPKTRRIATILAAHLLLLPLVHTAIGQDGTYLIGTPTKDSDFVEAVSKMPASMLDIGLMRLEDRLWRRFGLLEPLSGMRLQNIGVYIHDGALVAQIIGEDAEGQPDDCIGAWHDVRAALSMYPKEVLLAQKGPDACFHIADAFSPAGGPDVGLMVHDQKQDPCAIMRIVVQVNKVSKSERSLYRCDGDFYGDPVSRP